MRFFFSSVSFILASGSFDLSDASFQSKWQMRQELWKLCPCKFLVTGVKRITFVVKRLQASFSYSFSLSLVQNQKLSSIIDSHFHWSSQTKHNLIPKSLRICRRIQCWKLGCIPIFDLEFYSRAFLYLHNPVSRWLLILSKSCDKSSLSNYKWPEFSYSLRYVGARVQP